MSVAATRPAARRAGAEGRRGSRPVHVCERVESKRETPPPPLLPLPVSLRESKRETPPPPLLPLPVSLRESKRETERERARFRRKCFRARCPRGAARCAAVRPRGRCWRWWWGKGSKGQKKTGTARITSGTPNATRDTCRPFPRQRSAPRPRLCRCAGGASCTQRWGAARRRRGGDRALLHGHPAEEAGSVRQRESELPAEAVGGADGLVGLERAALGVERKVGKGGHREPRQQRLRHTERGARPLPLSRAGGAQRRAGRGGEGRGATATPHQACHVVLCGLPCISLFDQITYLRAPHALRQHPARRQRVCAADRSATVLHWLALSRAILHQSCLLQGARTSRRRRRWRRRTSCSRGSRC